MMIFPLSAWELLPNPRFDIAIGAVQVFLARFSRDPSVTGLD
jgi:hypothetical protein